MRHPSLSSRSRSSSSVRGALSRTVFGAAVAASFLFASPARANDAAAAQALFDEAMALKAKEDWAGACPKFESSYKLDPALGTLLNLANCYEKVGKIASAWARWEEAYQWAVKHGDERAEIAKTQRDALAPRLPKLTIVVTSKASALSIERDTEKVTDAMYGVALPVDPGKHSIFVKRGDELLKTEKVEIVEAQNVEIKLDLAAIEKAAPPPKPKGSVVVVGTSPTLRKVGWAVGATGLATVVVAGAFEAIALVKKDNANGQCVDKFCTPTGKILADDAASNAEIGQWIGIAGLAVTAVGVTLLIVSPASVPEATPETNTRAKNQQKQEPSRQIWASPWVAPAPGGAPASIGAGGFVVGGTL